MIIGLTGLNGAGKGEAVEFLKKRGFQYCSLSDVIREELEKEGKPVTRQNLIERGNRLRQQYGSSILAERILKRLDPDKNYVVDSFRNPNEVAAFRSRSVASPRGEKDFILLKVTANPEIRFERIRQRARENDPKTWQEFQKLESAETTGKDLTLQQLVLTAEEADLKIENSGTLEQLHDQLKKNLQNILMNTPRPNWDQYFMEIAKVVALRSNCVKRKVAAVIVKDRRIISTGYNGTPRGVRNCNEGGCPRCSSMEQSGAKLDECLCSHAEENSITQAAYHGVSIKGSTLYTTFSPCLICTKMIINSGIAEVAFQQDYTLVTTAADLLREAEVHLRQIA
jgi:dCMP deaminase